jgi:ATP-binding cassette subfamily B protein
MSRIAEDVSRVRVFAGPAIMYLVNLVAVISFSLFSCLSDAELTLYVLAPSHIGNYYLLRQPIINKQ